MPEMTLKEMQETINDLGALERVYGAPGKLKADLASRVAELAAVTRDSEQFVARLAASKATAQETFDKAAAAQETYLANQRQKIGEQQKQIEAHDTVHASQVAGLASELETMGTDAATARETAAGQLRAVQADELASHALALEQAVAKTLAEQGKWTRIQERVKDVGKEVGV